MQKGDQLPSIRELSSRYRTSKSTVSTALEMLSLAGLIVIKPRYGAFILNNPNNESSKQLDWESMKKRSAYVSYNERLQQAFERNKNNSTTTNISLLSLSDGVYVDLLNHASTNLAKTLKHDPSMLEIYPGNGIFELKTRLAEHMQTYGMNVEPHQIFITSTIHESLNLVEKLLIWKGGSVFYEDPGVIQLHSPFINKLGAFMHELKMDDEGIMPEEFIKNLSIHRKGILITFPHLAYPTGVSTSIKRRKEILQITANADIPIVEVEESRELVTDAPPPYYVMDKRNSTIYIGSITRTMPLGLPLSWIVVPDRLISTLAELQFYQANMGYGYVQMLVNEMFRDGSYYHYLMKLHRHIEERNAFSEEILNRHLKGVTTWTSAHPFVNWMELPFESKWLAQQEVISAVPGNLNSKYTPKHIIYSKMYPDKNKYEESVIAFKEAILKFI